MHLERPAPFDLAIIGGGVNGCGIARDAAGRGASVVLLEQSDLASGTSSASTKLIHGGLRYLEHYEFRLVREALKEREVLWRLAPHIVWPLRFVLPYHRGLRPRWVLRLGLALYDNIGGRKLLPPTRTIDLRIDPAGAPLKPEFLSGFEYSDCWVDDARLVVLNARDAADRGAQIRTRCRVVRAERSADEWLILTKDALTGREEAVRTKILVNAAGPWASDVLRGVPGSNSAASVRLVQGSHIVVRKLFKHDRAYIFQNRDKRIIFAIPYEEDFTLVGTTDGDFEGDLQNVTATEEEIVYLCSSVSEYFKQDVDRQDVIWTYSGVRPLYNDGASRAQEATRDYVLDLDAPGTGAPILSIFGGKITTYRRLAESALNQIREYLPVAAGPAWTGTVPLPGGDFPPTGCGSLIEQTMGSYPFLRRETAARLVRAYGTRVRILLDGASSVMDLGNHFGADLYALEVAYLISHEWALSADDVLWRRSKLGLRLNSDQKADLVTWMNTHVAEARASPRKSPTTT